MRYTLDDVKKSMPEGKAKRDSIWVKLWPRKLANILALCALNKGIKPNAISIVAVIDTLVACCFLSINNKYAIIVGMLLLNIFIVLDCMDGAMARTSKRNSYMGEFYDALGGYTVCAFALFAFSICAYNSFDHCILFYEQSVILIILGAVGCISDIFSRLIYQKYTVNIMMEKTMLEKNFQRENDVFYIEKPNWSITYIRLEIDRQLGVGGFFPPIMFISYIGKFMDIILILYSIYHIAACVAVAILFCFKASRFSVED